jgi:glycogen operon protein
VDWDGADADLLAFTRKLIAFRKAHPALRQSRFLHGETRHDGASEVEWLGFGGGEVGWRDPGLARLCVLVRCAADMPHGAANAVLIAFNGAVEDAPCALPPPPAGSVWVRALDTAAPDAPETEEGAEALIRGDSLAAFVPRGA